MDEAHCIVQFGVGTSTSWIDVLSDGTTKQERVLGNDGETAPDCLQTEFAEISPINFDLPFAHLHSPEQGLGDRTLASTGSADDADFLSWLDIESEPFQNQGEVWSVSKLDIVERDSAGGRPGFIGSGIVRKIVSRFGLEFSIVLYSLDTVLLVSTGDCQESLTIFCWHSTQRGTSSEKTVDQSILLEERVRNKLDSEAITNVRATPNWAGFTVSRDKAPYSPTPCKISGIIKRDMVTLTKTMTADEHSSRAASHAPSESYY